MKAYDLNTRFTFGKYEGRTLEEVFQQDPSYIEKCLITVEDFAIDDKSIQKLFEKYPDIDLSDEAIDTNLDKLDALEMEDGDLMFGDEVYDDEFEDYDEAGSKISGADDDFEDDFDDDDFDDFADDDEDDFDDDDDF